MFLVGTFFLSLNSLETLYFIDLLNNLISVLKNKSHSYLG